MSGTLFFLLKIRHEKRVQKHKHILAFVAVVAYEKKRALAILYICSVQYICPCIFPLSFFGEVKNLSDRKEALFRGRRKEKEKRPSEEGTRCHQKGRENLHGMTATRT